MPQRTRAGAAKVTADILVRPQDSFCIGHVWCVDAELGGAGGGECNIGAGDVDELTLEMPSGNPNCLLANQSLSTVQQLIPIS